MVNNDIIVEEHLFKTHFDTQNTCNIELPKEGDKMALCVYQNLLERPCIVYSDFESSVIPTGEAVQIHMHKATSACCNVVCTFDSSRNKLYEFIGENCVIELSNTLQTLADDCSTAMKKHTDVVMSNHDKYTFIYADSCYVCNGEFTKTNYKVRDHCHRTGKCRGAAHVRCDMNCYNKRYLPAVFHKLRGYDSHTILKEAFGICGTDTNITAMPNSMEKCMAFGIGDIKFIDSFQFLASSLATLAENLSTQSTDNYEVFEILKK